MQYKVGLWQKGHQPKPQDDLHDVIQITRLLKAPGLTL